MSKTETKSRRYEKAIEAEGKHYILGFGFDELALIEQTLDRGIFEVMNRLNFREMSVIFWAMLQERQSYIEIKESNKIVDQAGYDNVTLWIAEAIRSYFPTAKVKGDLAT